MTLVEREEEVCIFYERQNVQEQMLRDGESKINEFDENLRFLKIQLQEELRQIELLRSKRPEKKKLDNELVDLQIQHLKAREEMKQLEEKLANPERARRLGGSDLNIEDLKKAENEAFKIIKILDKLRMRISQPWENNKYE